MNRCAECNGETLGVRENFRYTLAGGWSATVEGVLVHRCQKCGAYEASIEKMSPLQREIVRAVILKPSRLAGEEIAFLRHHLGLSGRELARTMGVTPQALSRWEQGRDPIGGVSDRALRMLVALDGPKWEVLPRESLAAIEGGDGQPMRIVVSMIKGEWRARAAATVSRFAA